MAASRSEIVVGSKQAREQQSADDDDSLKMSKRIRRQQSADDDTKQKKHKQAREEPAGEVAEVKKSRSGVYKKGARAVKTVQQKQLLYSWTQAAHRLEQENWRRLHHTELLQAEIQMLMEDRARLERQVRTLV